MRGDNLDPLAGLPSEITLERVLDSSQAAAFVGVSLPHFRRLYRSRRAPDPIKLSDRKYGWQVRTLMRFLEERSTGEEPSLSAIKG